MEWNSSISISMEPQISDIIDLEEVRRLYCEEELSTYTIAERLRVNQSAVSYIMRRNNIPRRSHVEAARLVGELGRRQGLVLDPKEIRRLYWEEGLSSPIIAERFGRASSVIRRVMMRNNIPRRSLVEAMALANGRALTIGEIKKTHKFCSRCGEVKPVNEFYTVNKFYKNGRTYDSRCRKCRQESRIGTKGKKHFGLYKRPFPLDNKCELCGVNLNQKYDYHHWDDNNLNLGIWVCGSCDFLAEGLEEINKNPWKVSIYRRLKEEIEEVEKTYVYLGPFKPPNGIYRLFLDGKQTHKWCSRCGRMLSVNEFYKHLSNHDGLFGRCKECILTSQLYCRSGHFRDLHKRSKPDHCELCNNNISPERLGYHHWDDANTASARSKGVYTCHTNKCHNLAEAVDLLDSGSLLPDKYSKLKREIIELEVEKTSPLEQLTFVSK